MKGKFKMLEHTADIKFLINGKDLNGIFENSARAFSNYISSGEKIKSIKKKEIKLEADNIESLLYQFIDNLIYLLDAEDFAVSTAKININDNYLTAELFGDNTKNYHLNHVKAATYAEMYIKKKGTTYEAQIVLDV